jgi:hypothetical protein
MDSTRCPSCLYALLLIALLLFLTHARLPCAGPP